MARKITLLIILSLQCLWLHAQQVTITGAVKDPAGQPLAGATITLLSKNTSTIAGNDGRFSIQSSGTSTTLRVTYVGYKAVDYHIAAGQKTVAIVLQSEGTSLSDVVVVGYGTSSKKNLLGAVGSVTGEQIEERKTTQISEALQGAIPGVLATRTSATPGYGATITIRGVTSLGSNAPLVIIDGAPGNIDDVAPGDVENISVLKDAASASIYGSRAAAGVILITTKRAKAGQASITYSADFGWQNISALPQYVDAARYVALYDQMQVNDGLTPTYSQDVVNNYAKYNAQDPQQYANTNWQKLFYNNPAFQETHNLAINLGNDIVRSRINVGYIDQKGLEPNRNYNRMTLRSNTDYNINKQLSASVDVAYNRTNPTGPHYYEMYAVRQLNPTYPAFYADGRYAQAKTGGNPMALNQQGGFTDSVQNQLSARLRLNYMPVKGLKLSGIFAPNLYFSSYRDFSKIVSYGSATDPTDIIATYGTTNALTQRQIYNQQLNMQFLANYTKDFGADHHLTALAGFEENDFHYEINSEYRDGFTLTDYNVLSAGSTADATNGGNINESALRSFFGRVDYNYKGKYFIQGILRDDGSSRFAPGHRWGLFPAASAGWIVSEENFMHNTLFSFLKVRGDWGQVGNQNIGNYPYQSLINFGTTLMYNNGAVTSYPEGYQGGLAIQNISWETTTTTDLGLDMGFLKNRLNVSLDGYYKNTTGILLSLPVAAFIGLSAAEQNAGAMKNTGWEATLTWKDHIGTDFSYTVSGNISNNENKVTDLHGINTLGNQAIIQGQEYDVWYGYKAVGLFQNAAEVATSPKLTGKEQPGDVRYQDINGDGKISADGDEVPLGSSLPHYTYGGSIGAKYKNFDLNITIQGVGHQLQMLSGLVVKPFEDNFGNVQTYVANDYWTPANPKAKYPRLTYTNENVDYAPSSYWLINSAYFRLKNATLGYTLPLSWTQHAGIKNARIYIAGDDLFYLSHVPKGWDPENIEGYPGSQDAYPITRTLLAGLSVQF
jgi:TonB-linked SusC/RagA family outer membrane protein